MQIDIVAQGLKDPPVLSPHNAYMDLSRLETMTCIVIEAGMSSGAPSVMIMSGSTGYGNVLLQTSLDKFVSAAYAMLVMAETRFGWKQSEGSFTLLPPDKETCKALLEALKKELEEWDNNENSN